MRVDASPPQYFLEEERGRSLAQFFWEFYFLSLYNLFVCISGVGDIGVAFVLFHAAFGGEADTLGGGGGENDAESGGGTASSDLLLIGALAFFAGGGVNVGVDPYVG
mmetsp:Transcript_6881/g.14358  ORF Transcript_6881/g.14358 Transcript_6881/m.14358 type:complete len:107 (-) Transcript_6881:900-1220(-)